MKAGWRAKDLPLNKEIWFGNSQAANVYKRVKNGVWMYTFYRYGKPTENKLRSFVEFDTWRSDVDRTARQEAFMGIF